MHKPIVCLDFDGVCHSYTSGWKGAAVIPDDPVPGLFEFLREANEHFEVHVFSSRSNQEGGIDAMRRWFLEQAKAQGGEWRLGAYAMLIFPTTKPPAFLGIDDRVLTFTGKWPTMEEMKNFQPWNKKGS